MGRFYPHVGHAKLLWDLSRRVWKEPLEENLKEVMQIGKKLGFATMLSVKYAWLKFKRNFAPRFPWAKTSVIVYLKHMKH